MGKRLNLRIAIVIFAMCLIFVPIRVLGAEPTEKKVTLASPSHEAMRGYNEYQEMYRYTYEYLEMIATYADWDIEIVYAQSDDLNEALLECLAMVREHRADLAGSLLANDALTRVFVYPDNAYGAVHTVLLTQQDNIYLYENNLNAQEHLRVAAFEGATQRNRETEAYLKSKNIPYIMLPCSDYDTQRSLLKNGQADVMIGVDVAPVDGMRQVAAYAERDMYFAGAQGSELLIRELDEAICQVNQVQPDFQPTLFKKHFTIPLDTFALTKEQRAYIQNRAPVRVLFNIDAPPFQFKDKHGAIKGVFVDVLTRISELTGLQFTYVEPENGLSVKEMINGGHCDMVLSMPIAKEWVSHYGILHSAAVIDSGYIKIVHPNVGRGGDDWVLALPRGTLVEPDFTPKETVYYASAKACMDAVNSGQADCAILNEMSFSYYYAQHPYRNFELLQFNQSAVAYGFAFAKPLDIELATIVNAAIRSLSDAEIYSNIANIMSDGAQATLWGMYMWDPIRITIIGTGCILLVFITLFLLTSYTMLRRKNRQLVKASAAKSEFLSHVSHEIRTPLNSIIGFSDLASSERDNAVKAEYLANIQSSGRYLLGIINEMLDMSNMERRPTVFEKERVNLSAIIENARTLMAEPARQRGILLRFTRDFPVGLLLEGDRQRLEQIYITLLSNAIRYSHPGGSVECVTKVLNAQSGPAVCELVVSDQGVGMSEAFLKEIFKPFAQEKNQYTASLNSCGLGLSIVHKYVTAMGGEIRVESKLGAGSKFTVRLPVVTIEAEREPEARKPEAAWDFNGVNILLCEDHALNAKLVKKLLESKGAVLHVAENGRLGLEQYRLHPSGYYKAVLMDIHMPVMDGKEAARAIRSSGLDDSRRIPIIAVTADAVAEGLSELASHGFDAYVPKPVDPKILYQALDKHLAGARA